jgi:hypothetical protein
MVLQSHHLRCHLIQRRLPKIPLLTLGFHTVTPTLSIEPGIASNANDTCDVQTLQGLQLGLDHGDTRANSPVRAGAMSSFSVTEEEGFLVQHYARNLGKWVN